MTIEEIKELLSQSKSNDVITAVDQIVSAGGDKAVLAQAYYLRGNAYRQAMNNYLESMELELDGPAAHAYSTIQEILNFYDHDLYNP